MMSRNILQKAILLITAGLLGGCSFGANPPAVGEIQVQPSTTLIVGEKAILTISASGQELEFEWTAQWGTITNPTQPATTYIAPHIPGIDTVTVKIKYEGGEIIRNITFEIVAPPPSPTLISTDLPVPTHTLTLMPSPEPIACNHPAVTKDLFPQLADVNGQFAMYGPEGDSNILCQAVYDIVHTPGKMAVHIRYENVGQNFGWWGIATADPNGYDASHHSQLCFWVYAEQPDQVFRVKMKDIEGREGGVVVITEAANQWRQICVDISTFAQMGIQVNEMNNINLGFEQPSGSAEVWIANFEFVSFVTSNTPTPKATVTPAEMINVETLTPTLTPVPIISHTPNATQIFESVFREFDQQYKKSITSSIAYNAPQSMKLDDTVIIELLLNPSRPQPELVTQVVQNRDFVTSTAIPGELIAAPGVIMDVVTSDIQITDRMKAVLKSQQPNAFIVQELHDNSEQPISGINTTKWSWSVTAKEKGTKTLIIVVSMLLKKDNKEYWVEVESYNADIIVEVTISQRFAGWDWKWFLTVLPVPLFWWWLNNRKKKAEKPSQSLPPRKRYRS